MGCAPSKPEAQLVDTRLLEARTDNTDTWDADFRLPSKDRQVPRNDGRANNNGGKNADTKASGTRQVRGTSNGIERSLPNYGRAPQNQTREIQTMPLHLTAPPNQKFPLAAGGAPAIASRTTNGADLLASNKIDSNSGHSGMTRRPDLSAEARPPGLPSRGPQRVRRNPAPNGKLAPSLQPPRPDHIDPRNFDDYYLRGPDLGKGAFAQVFIGTEKLTQQVYAIKKITDRRKMRWSGRDSLLDEIGSLIKLREGPNILHLHDYFMEHNQCYLVTELLPGKELFERIIQKGTFTEEETRNACRCVLSALAYMHDRRITHRDLKPENLLLADDIDIDKVKLSDFGFSKTLTMKNECRTLCGTPGYLAPEILERWPAYDVKCDTWSFGVILFLLLGGYLPFDSHGSNDVKQVFERTRNGQYHFFPQRWQGISQAAKDLIAKCLTVSPIRRISSQAALAHEWMGEGLALPKTLISAKSLASIFHDTKKYRHEHYGQGRDEKERNRLQELNDDFTVYMEGRECDSIVSAVTGAGRTVGGMSVSSFQTKFNEDSPTGLPFSHFYAKEMQLGQGGFATVYRCRHKRSGMYYAVKQVDTTHCRPIEVRTLQEEITALKYLRGAPHIIRLYDVFIEGRITYLVLEEMRGGDLMHRIIAKEVYTEREARDVCKMLFSAVNYCHKKHIAHRDIKLDNLLLHEENNDASIKLADFGFAKKVKKQNSLKTMLGTPHYMAPEIFDLRSVGYDTRCDLWSLGVVVYFLLSGYLPFQGALTDLQAKVMRAEYQFHEEYWRQVSPSAKKLISGLLQRDPNDRLSAQQALASRWMMLDDAELSVVDLSLTQSRMERMVTGTDKFKNAVKAIIGVNKLQAAAGLKNSFRGNDLEYRPGVESLDTQYMESVEESDYELDIEVCFDHVYEIGEPIGSGSLAKVHSAKNLLTGKEYSVKKVIRKDLHPADFAALNDEIAVLQEIAEGGRTHVVCLYEVYEDPDATYIVMERIHGDSLIDRIIQKKKYTEFDAKEVVRNLLLGVRHCHKNDIAIRNLTLDNLLLSKDSESDIIITDFEIAKKVLYRNSLKTQCGTQEFVAPEVLENRPAYDVSCDMWSVGVIVFILLGGYYPFRGSSDVEVLRNVRYGIFEFREKLWKGVSDEAKSLVSAMITVNPDERITAEAALIRPWISADHSELSHSLMNNVSEIKKEVMAQKFKAAVQTVMATQKLQQLQM